MRLSKKNGSNNAAAFFIVFGLLKIAGTCRHDTDTDTRIQNAYNTEGVGG